MADATVTAVQETATEAAGADDLERPLQDAELEALGAAELRGAYRRLRALHGQLVSRALRELAEDGRYTGGHEPFGTKLGRDGQTLIAVKREQRAIARARQLRAVGMSLRAIAETLESEGLRSRMGTRFHASQIQRMVDEPADG